MTENICILYFQFSQYEDDMYVQLTFMETMGKYGMDAPAKKYQELLAKANYKLWHVMCRLVKLP